MIDPIEGLMTIAEIAITLAGFSGLMAAFRAKEAWTPLEQMRLINILLFCFIVVICALLPIFTTSYFSDSSDPWRLSCFLFGLSYGFLVLRLLWKSLQGEFRFSQRISYVLSIVAVGVIVVAVTTGLGVGFKATPSLLGLILMWGLVAAGSFFILSLQIIWGPRDDQ